MATGDFRAAIPLGPQAFSVLGPTGLLAPARCTLGELCAVEIADTTGSASPQIMVLEPCAALSLPGQRVSSAGHVKTKHTQGACWSALRRRCFRPTKNFQVVF